ncbi:MAG: PilZ domain-containing protein [Pirellulaceae bacterium]
MADEFWNYVVRRPRHVGRRTEIVHVQLRRDEGRLPDVVEAELVDLSRGGLQLVVPTPLSKGEHVQVRISCGENSFDNDVAATVRWLRRTEDGAAWHLGLRFKEELQFDLLGELFLNDALESE